MLDRLAASAATVGSRILVVAATGTGKTLGAAFYYRRICSETGGRLRMLFVAHREEILRQTQRMFQAVLCDGSFRELLGGTRQPRSPLFSASIFRNCLIISPARSSIRNAFESEISEEKS